MDRDSDHFAFYGYDSQLFNCIRLKYLKVYGISNSTFKKNRPRNTWNGWDGRDESTFDFTTKGYR